MRLTRHGPLKSLRVAVSWAAGDSRVAADGQR